MKTDCAIVILNYNGRDLLQECLPSIQRAVQKSYFICRMVILDNMSTDDSELWLEEHYPEIDFIKSGENLIYSSYNDFLTNIDEEFVILLNNDIKVDHQFIDPLLECLQKNRRCFLAASKALNAKTEQYEGSLSKMEMRYGLIWGGAQFKGYQKKIKQESITMQAGFGAFRRKMLVELGGFDRLYLPGTVEDTDLCFRAYRHGWVARYCPRSIVYHFGQVSFKKAFGESGIRRINRRNLYLFVWKNIRDPFLLMQHLFWLPIQLVKYLLCGQVDFLMGFFSALRMFPQAIERRKKTKKEKGIVSDRKIFSYSKAI